MINLDQGKKKIRKKKKNTFVSVKALYEGQELTLNAFSSGTFPINPTQGRRLKTLTLKQVFQRLPIVLAEVKVGNTSESLLNEIRQIIYSFYRAKQITKNVYNDMMNSVKVQYKNGYYICNF